MTLIGHPRKKVWMEKIFESMIYKMYKPLHYARIDLPRLLSELRAKPERYNRLQKTKNVNSKGLK